MLHRNRKLQIYNAPFESESVAWWLISILGAFRPKGRRFEPALTTTWVPWASPSLEVAWGASAWNSETVSVLLGSASE